MSKSIQIWDHNFSPENWNSLDIGLQEVGAKIRLNGVKKGEKICKKFFCRCNFKTFFWGRCINLRPLLSITWVSGGKKTFKRYPKSEHMDGYTGRQTHRGTFRLWKSKKKNENLYAYKSLRQLATRWTFCCSGKEILESSDDKYTFPERTNTLSPIAQIWQL